MRIRLLGIVGVAVVAGLLAPTAGGQGGAPVDSLPRCAEPAPAVFALDPNQAPVPSLVPGRRVLIQLYSGEDQPLPSADGEARLTLTSPGHLFSKFDAPAVRGLLAGHAQVVASTAGEFRLTVKWVREGGDCTWETELVLPAPAPCHARLSRPGPYPQNGELGSVGARRSMQARFTGCPGGAPAASSTHTVKAFAVRGLRRRPRARGRASVSSEHLDLFTGPTRDRIAERARIRRQTRLAGRARLVSVTTERTQNSDANGRIDDLTIGLNPPPTGNRFAKPMSALVVSYDAGGRAVGPKWLLRVRPTGSFQRKRPREFKVAVRRLK